MDLDSLIHLEFQFSGRARTRGGVYFSEGRVQVERADERTVEAVVQGSRPYDVSLARTGRGGWKLSCTCPAFLEFGPCKHIWATVLAARHEDGSGDASMVHAEPAGTKTFVISSEGRRRERDAVMKLLGGLGAAVVGRPIERDLRPADRGHENPAWGAALEELRPAAKRLPARPGTVPRQRLRFMLLRPWSPSETVEIEVLLESRSKRTGWSDPRPLSIGHGFDARGLAEEDRDILALLQGAWDRTGWWSPQPSRFKITPALQAILFPRLARTGRLHLSTESGLQREPAPLSFDGGGRWEFGISLARSDSAASLEGHLARGEERLPLSEVLVVLPAGLFATRERLGEVDWRGAWRWSTILHRKRRIEVPRSHERELLESVGALEGNPLVEAPGIAQEVLGPPKPWLLLRAPEPIGRASGEVACRVAFAYDNHRIPAAHERTLHVSGGTLVRVHRDPECERAALARLAALGARLEAGSRLDRDASADSRALPALVRALLAEGWGVEAEGKPYRSGGSLSLSVRSGVDWFDLEGQAVFGDASASLPELLRAIRYGSSTVRLSDGSWGLLPEEWLAGWGLAACASGRDGALRFARSQTWLLDALLAERGQVDVDAPFARARETLRRFDRLEPAREPPAFRGELRPYQREGLGWLGFLGELGLGGCLADDMGLGKTVQVLALLAREEKGRRRPSLVVAPRSIVFNWVAEAARFAPELSVHVHHGTARSRSATQLAKHALVITTYGTLRRDAELLSRIAFRHAILDEAQAIKNPSSQAAKAARLLQAERRFVLTGTPVENHLDDLWSLFEFLNPGMLGRSTLFRGLVGRPSRALRESAKEEAPAAAAFDADHARAFARALRPFVLRRTKEQVLRDLPPKTEQLLSCVLKGSERRHYEELRDHYRRTLLEGRREIDSNEMRMNVLEALLRLRQAACHPGLLDRERAGESSAKLDVLLPMLSEVAETGHKALVFSQFTRFLAIVRERLAAEGIAYEYLDGRTVQREAKVRRFQEDPACPLFLISLKAGGLGLNLAAADYVFLLDPWWNPAVERQAIDRAHRIGQTRAVNAYRLVARDTIEDKVLELQQRKRELAEAVLGEAGVTLRDLSREDLAALLS